MRHILATGALAALAGCAAPMPSLHDVPIAEARRLPESFGAAMPNTAADADIARWWLRFGDPTLVKLADLPAITPETVDRFVAEASAYLASVGAPIAKKAPEPASARSAGGRRFALQNAGRS